MENKAGGAEGGFPGMPILTVFARLTYSPRLSRVPRSEM